MRPNLTADRGRCYWLITSAPIVGLDRTLDKTATENARLAFTGIVEHAGLTGRYAVFAVHQLDFAPVGAISQPCRLRRAPCRELSQNPPPNNRNGHLHPTKPHPTAVHKNKHHPQQHRTTPT